MPPSAPRFGLDSLMLVIALTCVCAGVIRASTPLGVPLAVIATVALVRAMTDIVRHQATGARLSAIDKAAIFALSSARIVIRLVMALSHLVITSVMALFVGGCALVISLACGSSRSLMPIIFSAGAIAGGYGFHRSITRTLKDVES